MIARQARAEVSPSVICRLSLVREIQLHGSSNIAMIIAAVKNINAAMLKRV
jgi:hypothetical protein